MKNNKKVSFANLGKSGLSRYSGYVYEEFLPQLRWPQAGKVYKEMADNDPVIGSILYLAEMLIRGVDWTVEPASSSTKDKKVAKFVEECMNDMEMSWASVISEVLSMLTYGFSFHEVLYKVRRGPNEKSRKYKSKYSDGKIGWRSMPIRAQSSLQEWEFDDEGYVTAFVQMCPPNYDVVRIPMEKGLLFRTRVSRDNPEGKSLLRNAYRPWFFKKHFEEIEGIGIERDLAGFPVLTAPEDLDLWNDEDPNMVQLRKDAEALVASVRRDSEEGVLLPYGWDLKLLTSGSSRQIDIGSTIERYDNRIAITLLSDIILIGGSSSNGSFALTDNKQSILSAALQSQLYNIADVFNNTAVPSLVRLNFKNVTEMPKIVPGSIQTPSMSEVSLMLRAMGLDVSKDFELQNYLRHILSMPQLTDEKFKELYSVEAQQQSKEEGQQVDNKDQQNNVGDKNPNNNAHKDEETSAPPELPKDSSEKAFEQNDMNYTGQ